MNKEIVVEMVCMYKKSKTGHLIECGHQFMKRFSSVNELVDFIKDNPYMRLTWQGIDMLKKQNKFVVFYTKFSSMLNKGIIKRVEE